MAKLVEIPDIGVVEFPDDMPDEDIGSTIERDIVPNYAKRETTPQSSGTDLVEGNPQSMRPSYANALAETLQQNKLYGSVTSALGQAADKNIRRKQDGDWDLPLLKQDSDNAFVQAAGGLAVLGGQKLGARLDSAGAGTDQKAIQKVFHDFQQANNLSDDEVGAAWADLGNLSRQWGEGEKLRVLSNGSIIPNPTDSDWLDSEKAAALIQGAQAPEAAKASLLRNLPQIQTNLASDKLGEYEAGGGLSNMASTAMRPVVGRTTTPSEWAKQQGRDDMGSPKFVRDYEAYLQTTPEWKRDVSGLAGHTALGWTKVANTALGIAGLLGSDAAGQTAAQGTEAADLARAGMEPTGLAGTVAEEIPSVVAQVFGTRLLGAGASALAPGVAQSATTLGTYGLAGLQSAGLTYADELAQGTPEDEAREKAVRSGISTSLVTAAFGQGSLGGVERVAAGNAARGITVRELLTTAKEQGVKNLLQSPGLREFGRGVLMASAGEATEEGVDQLLQSFLTADPDTNLANAWDEALQAGAVGGILGGATDIAQRATQQDRAAVDLAMEALPDAPKAAAAALEPVNAPLTDNQSPTSSELSGLGASAATTSQEAIESPTALTEEAPLPTDESPLPQQPASETPPSDPEVPTSEVVTPPPVQQAPVETSPAPTGLEPTESLPEGTTPSAVTEGVGVPEQIPLGLDRQPVVDLTLQDLEDGDLETHRKQVYRNLDSLERQLDEAEDFGEALMADRNFATRLAEAQDAYNAVGNEKFRRDMMVAEPEDVAYEFRQLKPRVNTDKAKMAILFDVIGRRGLKDQMRPYFEAYANRSPDHAEQLAGMMEDAGQVLKEMQQAPPAEAPAIESSAPQGLPTPQPATDQAGVPPENVRDIPEEGDSPAVAKFGQPLLNEARNKVAEAFSKNNEFSSARKRDQEAIEAFANGSRDPKVMDRLISLVVSRSDFEVPEEAYSSEELWNDYLKQVLPNQPTTPNGQDTQRQPGPETPAEAPQTQSPLEGGPATDQAGVEGAVDAPDWADLNDWVFENYPQEYEASRYLDPGSQYGFHVKLWEMAGRPKIGSEPVPLSGEAPKATAGVSETPPYTPEEGAATGQAVFEGSVEESPLPTQEAQPHDPEKQTSLKNAATDADLQALGFDPILKPESRPHERVMNEAREAYDLDPGAASRLITEITQKPRVLSDFEDGLLKIELANRKIAQGKAQQAYFQAVESGANEETQANARAYLDELREGTFKAIVAAKMAGTEWGRAGAFRRRNINHDDWSLAAMEARFRIDALDGGKLTPAQEKLIAEMAEKIREADARSGIFDEAARAEAEGDTKKADSLIELARLVDAHTSDIAQAQKKLEARSRAPRRRQQIKALLDPKIEAARARIAARNAALVENLTDTTKLHAAIGSPEFFADLKDYAIIFSAKFVDVAMAIDQFRAEVVAELGDWIKPHIPELFRMSRAFYYENAASVDGDNSPTRESVLDGVDSEAPLDKRDVWALARAHIIEGLRGNNVLDAVFQDLSAKFPELTRDQVAEIYTDYGKTIYPSKNEATKELNRIRSIERIALQLKDVREGRMPKRTGFQRGEQDVEVRELNKQLREALRDSGLQVTDPEKQLQSALGATKRRMSNEIEELQRALDRKQPRTTDARQPVQLDEEGLQLKSKLEAKRKEYAEAFGEGISQERRITATLKSLDRQIAEEEQLLKDGILKKPRTEPVSTPEIEARRDKLREMRAHRRELYAAQNPIDPLEQAKKSAIEAGERLQQMIDSGDVAVRRKEPVQPDAELSALWDANEALRDQIAEMRKALPLTEGEVKAAVEKQIAAAEKTAAKIQAKLDSGDLSVEARPLGQRAAAVAADPRVQQIRAQIKQLNKELAARRRAALPKLSPEEARLKRVLQYAERAKKDLTRRIAARDVTPKERPTPLNDPEARKARRDVNTLKRKFNEIVLEEGLKNESAPKKIGRLAIDIPLRLPRAIMASLDVSGIGRQSWSVLLTRPNLAYNEFPKHFAFSEDAADRYQADLENHPDFELAESSGLALQSWRPGHKLHEMEEAYRSRLAKKIPLVSHSERGYVTYLNGVRMAYFTEMLKLLRARPDGMTPANLKSLAVFVNNMTGRGKLGKYEKSMDILSDVFFSPRYVSSRFQLLAGMAVNPLQILTGYRLGPKESRIARQIVGKEYTRLTVGASLLFGLLAFAASAFGGDGEDEKKFSFSLDPLSSDFGKVKIGEMRVDIGGGMNQPIVFLSRFAFGEKHGADGATVQLRGPRQDTRQSIGRLTSQFARSKFSPTSALLTDWAFETDLYDRPAYTSENLVSMYIPLPVAETYENYRKMGFGGASVAAMTNFVGLGSSSYGPQSDENYKKSAGKDLNTNLVFPIIDAAVRPLGKEVNPDLYDIDPRKTEFLIDR